MAYYLITQKLSIEMQIKTRTAVLLCSYNGSQYIRQQIDSIINQTEKEWTVFVSDDGSTDGTLDILQYYQEKLGSERFVIINGQAKDLPGIFYLCWRSAGMRLIIMHSVIKMMNGCQIN